MESISRQATTLDHDTSRAEQENETVRVMRQVIIMAYEQSEIN